MNQKNFIEAFGFLPKENTLGIFIKKYDNNYAIEVDFERKMFHFGGKIKVQGKDYQNITKPEDWVVFECVNRLLETGYKPENITLEKVYPAGHGFSGRLDVCVTRDDGSEYLLIECKTYGKEFDKALTRLKKDGGQLFTYFKFSNKADLIMLYASGLNNNELVYTNEIVKIEDSYRIGSKDDFYNNWNKITKQQGIWENEPYNFVSTLFTKADLKPLTKDESDKIFHGFASILRKHSVSDKPNAFNKIFNLFLAKLYDEAKGDNMELDFHWKENDNAIDFQVRLINLHKNGLFEFLAKETEGIQDSDFQHNSPEELLEKKKKMLKFNNVFAIKDVLDDASFDENQRVLKDVVKLLEKYQIRYPRKQQYLSDFFELLLTTGLKQEVGQYFTPPPVTKFIVRSLPIKKMILDDINNEAPKLPAVIDYAAGSGHFITEALEEYQDIINSINIDKDLSFPKAKTAVKSWVADPYNSASTYVYGIEKDYRLVKVAKVGCYFYGDGVAQIIHGDGLDSFATSKTYKGLLKENINIEDSAKAKFSVVISNPPYAVNDCKDDLEYIGAQNEFTLYPYLTDKSKDIECLFVERTKHLLKDGGVASIILPSSILNNTGIQTKTREIILQYFDIVAIAEFGSNTFMATSTNTVTLFLRRRSNKLSVEWKKSVANFFETLQDNTINGIVTPAAKYVRHVWEGIAFSDYITLLQKAPNATIQQHEIYKEYRKKLKTKTEKEFWDKLLGIEADKLYYFIIALNQQVVLVKSGEKEAEKRFLGYEFKERRGGEGMHAMQRGKSVDECTQLYNPTQFNDATKASTYILKAFEGDYETPINASMQNNVSRHYLVDMLTFDRVEFEKTISLGVKKKVKIDSKWNLVSIGDVLHEQPKSKIQVGTAKSVDTGKYNFYTSGEKIFRFDNFLVDGQNIYLSTGGNAVVKFIDGKAAYSTDTFVVKSNDENKIKTKLIFYFLESIISIIDEFYFKGLGLRHLQKPDFRNIQIPLPPLDIQQKIVAEIEILEAEEGRRKKEIKNFKYSIDEIIDEVIGEKKKIGTFCNYSSQRVESQLLTPENYIGVDNLLQETKGKTNSSFVPNSGTATKYKTGDILLSNIRPYLKKIWFADVDGGASNDVLVLQKTNQEINAKYLFYHLKQDKFFEYEMEGKKGVKMPRGDKKQILDYQIPLPPLSEQQKIVTQIETIEQQIAELETQLQQIPQQKEAVLKKYL